MTRAMKAAIALGAGVYGFCWLNNSTSKQGYINYRSNDLSQRLDAALTNAVPPEMRGKSPIMEPLVKMLVLFKLMPTQEGAALWNKIEAKRTALRLTEAVNFGAFTVYTSPEGVYTPLLSLDGKTHSYLYQGQAAIGFFHQYVVISDGGVADAAGPPAQD